MRSDELLTITVTLHTTKFQLREWYPWLHPWYSFFSFAMTAAIKCYQRFIFRRISHFVDTTAVQMSIVWHEKSADNIGRLLSIVCHRLKIAMTRAESTLGLFAYLQTLFIKDRGVLFILLSQLGLVALLSGLWIWDPQFTSQPPP